MHVDLGQLEIARFLALRPPFSALAPEDLGELVGHAELEFHTAGTPILTEDGGPVTFLRVIHSGSVSIVHDGRLLDLLGPGDSLGHDAMLAGMAPGFEARAAQDTLCYRIPAANARPLLDRAAERGLGRASGPTDVAHQPVVSLIRTPTVLCRPEETVGEVARRMTDAGASAAVVELGAGALGIVTDSDLRTRVVSAGLRADVPVELVMSAPAFTVAPERSGAEVLFELLERGIHHVPVRSAAGRVVGVIEDGDLFAVRQRSWFGARRAIAGAQDAAALAGAAAAIAPILLELHAHGVGALESARVLSALTDALVVRALELATQAAPVDTDGLVWVALRSHARHELTPATTPAGAVICPQRPSDAWRATLSRTFGACGLPAALTARSSAQWLAAGPEDIRATAVLSDRRLLWGTPREPLPELSGADRERVVAMLAAQAAAAKVPTGFDEGGALAGPGAGHATIDIHAAAVQPIQALARWAGAAAGEHGGSTSARLTAAARAGVLDARDAGALSDAFRAAFDLRMAHQVEQLAAGRAPDDRIATADLSPFVRNQLREVFRTISAVRRRLA